MSSAPAPAPMEPTFRVTRVGGLRPLPLLTLINYFNYLDRQLVYGMSPMVGVGEGAYGPSANALLCADAPPSRRGRALGIYNLGMAFGGTSGLVLGGVLSPVVGWRGVFWVAGAPAVLLAAASAFIAAPPRIARERTQRARAYLLSPTYLMALAGGTLAAFGANGLIFWARHLIVEDRHFSETVAGVFMGAVGLFAGAGGVIAGGYAGDALTRRRAGGHSLTIGVSMLVAAPLAALTLIVTSHPPFMVLTTVTVFFLSVYNGPAAAVVDELGPPHLAATLQAVFMFWLQLLGNTPAASVVGLIADHSSVPVGLQVTVVAFFLSGVLFLLAARRQRLAGARYFSQGLPPP